MKILMIGSGGREHALIKKLLESPKCTKLYCAPGNGGISRDAELVNIGVMDKEDYLLAMERSPIKDVEIKVLLKGALTDEINSREVYMKGIDHSYYYEGYTTFKAEDL